MGTNILMPDTAPQPAGNDSSPFYKSFVAAAGFDPDAEAKARAAARMLPAPVTATRAQPQLAQQQVDIQQQQANAQHIAQSSPQTQTWYSKLTNAIVGKDDTGVLGALGSILGLGPAAMALRPTTAFGVQASADAAQNPQGLLHDVRPANLGKSIAAGVGNLGVGTYTGAESFLGDTAPALLGGLAQKAQQQRQAWTQFRNANLNPDAQTFTGKAVNAGVEGLPTVGGAVLGSVLTGNPLVGAGIFGATSGLSSYGEARDQGASPNRALAFGGVNAAINTALGLIPGGQAATAAEKTAAEGVGNNIGQFMKNFLTSKFVAQDIGANQLAAAGQSFNQWATLDENKGKTFSDWLAEQPAEQARALIGTLTMLGTMHGTGVAARMFDRLTGRAQVRDQQMQQAEQVHQTLQEMSTLSTASKLRERDPEGFHDFVNQASEGGPVDSVYVHPDQLLDALHQTPQPAGEGTETNPLAPEAASALATQAQQAKAAGTDVRIPIADYETHIAGTSADKALLDHLKTDPDGMSRAEASDWLQQNGERVAQEMSDALSSVKNDNDWNQSAQRVHDDIKAQLDKVNPAGARTNKNESDAAMMSAAFSTMASRLKNAGEGKFADITPEDLYRQYAPRIIGENNASAEGAAAGRLGQADAGGRGAGRGRVSGEPEERGPKPLEGATVTQGKQFGPIADVVRSARTYAARAGIDLKRQSDWAHVKPELSARIAQAYEEARHEPHNPKVKAAYQEMIRQTMAQYETLHEHGYRFHFFGPENDPYAGNGWNALRDLRDNKRMGVFSTEAGFGSNEEFNPDNHPLLQDTGLQWPYGQPDGPLKRVLANDLFRAVHDAFGHGMEGAGFRAEGEENAWQAHARLFTGDALKALTAETRGQNSWVNFGPHGEHNRTARLEDTRFADQKATLLPDWAHEEGRVGDQEHEADPLYRGGAGAAHEAGPSWNARTGEYDRPPADRSGNVALQHFSGADELASSRVTDPLKWFDKRNSQSLSKSERNAMSGAPGRTYFGIATYEPGGYKGEFHESVPAYESHVPYDQLYDVVADPDGLRAPLVGRTGEWEHAIKDAGYLGYWVKDPELGLVATVFHPLDVTPVDHAAMKQGGKFYQTVDQDEDANRAEMDRLIERMREQRAVHGAVGRGVPPIEPSVLRRIMEGNGSFYQSAVDLQHEPLNVQGTGPGGRVTNRDFAKALTERQRDTFGRELHPESSEEDYNTTLQALVDEHQNQKREADDGEGWYKEDIAKAIAVTKEHFPQLKYAHERDLFLTLAALLSPQQAPRDNWDNAMHAYQGYADTGRIALRKPNGKQFGVESHTSGLRMMQHLIDTLGIEKALDWVQTPKTGREMAQMRKDSGLFVEKDKLGGYLPNEVNLNDEKPGIYAFGPKVGDFAQNSVGIDPRAVTIDLWATRTYNRIVGRLLDVAPGVADKGGISDTPRGKAERELMKQLFTDAAGKAGIQPSAMQAALWYFEQRLYSNHGIRTKSESFSGAAEQAVLKRGGDPDRIAERRAQSESENAGRGAEAIFRPAEEGSGAELHQGAAQHTGAFDPAQNVIALFKTANLSTFQHESAHFYLEFLNKLAKDPEAPQQIRDDLGQIMDWFGIKGGADAWNKMSLEEQRPYHEQFARGFEAYLFSGKAPSLKLQPLFQRFRQFMLSVYQKISALGVRVSPEIRGVYDRMLATDNEIAEAEHARSMLPLGKEHFDDNSWQEYQKQLNDAHQGSVSELEARSLRDMQWLTNARGREIGKLKRQNREALVSTQRAVEAEVRQEPVYRAMDYFKKGLWNGEPTGESHKLSIEEVKAMYPDEATQGVIMNKLGFGKYGMLGTENAIHPEQAADLFGYSSGDHMIRAMMEAEPFADKVKGITEQRLLEDHGELTTEQGIKEAADRAIFSDLRARVMATELNALNKKAGRPAILAQAARAYAETQIARTRVRDLKPALFEAAAARSGRAVMDHLAKGKTTEAAAEKRNQLINTYMAKEALRAKDEIGKALAYFDRMNRATGKQIDRSYLSQIHALLDRVDIKQARTLKDIDSTTSLADWIKDQQDQGFDPIVTEDMAARLSQAGSYKNMSIEDIRGLRDSIKNIEALGRLKNKLLTAKNDRAFSDARDDIADRIEGEAYKDTTPPLETNTRKAKLQKWGNEFLTSLRKLSSLVHEMDGFKEGGPLWEYFLRPINEAGDREGVMISDATHALEPLFRNLGDLSKKEYIPEINNSLSLEGRLAIALNMGNDINRERVMTGENWSPEQVDAVLRTLDSDHWHFVQGIWDHIGSYWPEIAAKQERVTGVEPERVEPNPIKVHTSDGQDLELPGGYYPIAYNADRSTRAASHDMAEVAKQMLQGAYTASTTRRGHTQARVESTGMPLRYDLGVISQHVAQVIHDLTHHEMLIDTTRLMRDGKISAAVRNNYGPEVHSYLTKALRDIAAGDQPAADAMGRAINYLRTGAITSQLGWNLFISTLHGTNLVKAMQQIGARHVLYGVSRWIGDLTTMKSTVDWIAQQSPFMAGRAKHGQKDMAEIQAKITGEPKWKQVMNHSLFLMLEKGQLLADIPTWLGQYHKSTEAGEEHERAVALADQAVLRIQGGGGMKDRAGILRGEKLSKLFTAFYSFTNVNYNLMAEAMNRTQKEGLIKGSPQLVATTLSTMLFAAYAHVLVRAAYQGQSPDKKELLRTLPASVMSLFPIARDFAPMVQGTADDAAPAGLPYKQIVNVTKDALQGKHDAHTVQDVGTLAGVLFHYPTGQIIRTWRGLEAIAEGKTKNPGALVVGPPPGTHR